MAATPEHLELVFGVYLVASIGLTGWLAVVLNRNGKIFLRDVFHESPDIGEAVNRLLTIGFFMLSLGYAFLILRAESISPSETPLNFVVNRLGLLLVSLGVLHFVNMAVFAKIRRRMQMKDLPPPVPPQVILPPPGDPGPQPAQPTGQPPRQPQMAGAGPRAGGRPRATYVGPTLPPPPGARPGPFTGDDPWAPNR